MKITIQKKVFGKKSNKRRNRRSDTSSCSQYKEWNL